MKVSIVIPAYNAERFLAETLVSVKEQTWTDYEVIVIDDGSTDGTRSVVEKFPFVRYRYQSNQGPAAARNAGLSQATGSYVSFLDADDRWHPEMLEHCMAILEAQPAIGAVHTNWIPIDAGSNAFKKHSGWQPWRGDIFEHLLLHIPFNTSSIVWRKSYWDDIGGYDLTPEINDDWINWLRIARRGCRFDAIEKPLVYRRTHEESITHQQSKRIVEWHINALDQISAEYDLPQPLCRRAYAEIHWIATNISLRDGRSDEADTHFRRAVTLNPSLLELRSTYYAIANGGKPLDKGVFDLALATQRIAHFLELAFSESQQLAALAISQRNARSVASLCLAQMAYEVGERYNGAARRCLLDAFWQKPTLFIHRQNQAWFLRLLFGPRLLKRILSLVQKTQAVL